MAEASPKVFFQNPPCGLAFVVGKEGNGLTATWPVARKREGGVCGEGLGDDLVPGLIAASARLERVSSSTTCFLLGES
jgi:hypothetical protein